MLSSRAAQPADAGVLYEVILGVRAAFHRLARFADDLHADLGVTAAMRASLEHFARHGPATVPQVAAAKGVSRQHIQNVVNGLLDAGLVELRPNPAHARSSLVALSREGRALFDVIRARERFHLAELSRALEGTDLRATAETLRTLNRRLAGNAKEDEDAS